FFKKKKKPITYKVGDRVRLILTSKLNHIDGIRYGDIFTILEIKKLKCPNSNCGTTTVYDIGLRYMGDNSKYYTTCSCYKKTMVEPIGYRWVTKEYFHQIEDSESHNFLKKDNINKPI